MIFRVEDGTAGRPGGAGVGQPGNAPPRRAGRCYTGRVPLERELKFSLAEASPPSLPEVEHAFAASGFDVEALPTVRLTDTYHDDQNGSLRRAGLALRLRRGGGRTLATLKTKGSAVRGLHERDELELEVPEAAAHGSDGRAARAAWPPQVRRRLAGLVDPDALTPRLEVASTRVRFRVTRAGSPVAVISYDDVDAGRPGGEARVSFSELEIEAVDGADVGTLRAVAETLGELGALVPDPATKLERAEALLPLVER